MATPLIPQEIYLLERFCSSEYFEKMRDGWAAMLKHAEDMLARFMRQLPPDYRGRPLSRQPDRVWGERVLPNFRQTMQGLNGGYIGLTHGDLRELGWANGVSGGMRGQRMDYPEDWMDDVEPGGADKFGELADMAERFAWPIQITSNGGWTKGELTDQYDEIVREPLNPPTSWPVYRLDPGVRVKSGGRTPKTGIYLPDVDDSFPTLLIAAPKLDGEASTALVPGPPQPDGRRPSIRVPCTWTLIERVADSGGGIPVGPSAPTLSTPRLRCDANQPCPRQGYWFTPARLSSRRRFDQGEVMPDVGGAYGATIWQWDDDQAP